MISEIINLPSVLIVLTMQEYVPFDYFQYKISIRSLKHIFCCLFFSKRSFSLRFYSVRHFDFQRGSKKITHSENEKPENKQPRMNNPHPPFYSPISQRGVRHSSRRPPDLDFVLKYIDIYWLLLIVSFRSP